MNTVPVLSAEKLARTYRDRRFSNRRVTALEDVSLELRRGRITALVGRNGAGKTTLLRILAGEIKPDHGTVRCGKNGRQPRVGWLPEGEVLPPALSLRAVGRAACPSPSEQAALNGFLELLGLRSLQDRPVRTLSRGQHRRAGLAVVLAASTAISLLDEPFTGIDPVEQESCRNAIRWAAVGGRAVLLATHQVDTVEELADDLVILDHGRVALSGDLGALLQTTANSGPDATADSGSSVDTHAPGRPAGSTGETSFPPGGAGWVPELRAPRRLHGLVISVIGHDHHEDPCP